MGKDGFWQENAAHTQPLSGTEMVEKITRDDEDVSLNGHDPVWAKSLGTQPHNPKPQILEEKIAHSPKKSVDPVCRHMAVSN